MKAIFVGYTAIDKPAQFKVPTKTRIIGGVEVVEFYKWFDVKNGDDFVAGNGGIMTLTEQELENRVSQCSGTWVKRRNLRKKLTSQSNAVVYEKINECKGKIRDLRAMGARESALRDWYAEVTKYELMILY